MKRDARIGLAIILVLGLFTTFLVARSLHQRSSELEQAEAAAKEAKPATASVQAEPDGWTPDTDKPTEPFSSAALQAQQQELDRYLEGRIPATNPGYAANGYDSFSEEAAPTPPTGRPNVLAPQPNNFVSPTPESQPAPKAQPAEQVYTIQAGDNPWKISAKLFGDGKYAMKLMAANPGVDPAKLKIGQQIKVPALAGITPVAQASPATQTLSPSADESVMAEPVAVLKTHTVQSGETLAAIAHKYYGSAGPKSIKRLTDANPGLDAKRLKVGSNLKVPAAQ